MQNANWFRNLFAAPTNLLGRNQRAERLVDLAEQYRKQKQYDRAIPLLERALVIRKQQDGKPDEDTLTARLGELYQEAGRYREAETIFLKLLALERVDDRKSQGVTPTENSLLALYRQSEQYEKAQPLCAEIIARYREADDQEGGMQFLEGWVVPLYQRLGLLEDAVAMQRHVVVWVQQSVGEKSWKYPHCLLTLAKLHEEMGQYAQALPYYRSVLEIREQNYDPNSLICIDAFEAGVGICFNQTKMDIDMASADVARCLSRLGDQDDEHS